ncbi:MAG: VOC family protein [Phycisphaerales bacterium]
MPAPVVHFEIGCKDAPKTAKFYADLLGWKFDTFGTSHMTQAGMATGGAGGAGGAGGGGGGGGGGIGGHIHSLGHPPHNNITIYAQVDNLEAYLKKAESLGGKTLIPPQEVPGMGHFAWIQDPEGTCFGLWKPMNK